MWNCHEVADMSYYRWIIFGSFTKSINEVVYRVLPKAGFYALPEPQAMQKPSDDDVTHDIAATNGNGEAEELAI